MSALVRLCVMGDGGAGKTAATIQMCHQHFVEQYDPTIEDSYRRNVVVNDQTLLLEILDTAGQEDFSPLRDQWIRESEGFLLIYDVTNRNSLSYLPKLLEQIERTKADTEPDVMKRVIVCGNKIDKVQQRQVSSEEAQKFGLQYGVTMAEFSAKTRLNLTDVFNQLIVKVGEEKGFFDSNNGNKKKMDKKKSMAASCSIL